MTGILLAPSLRAACERWAARPALTHRDRTLKYGELWERILSLACAYRSLGIQPGDRIVSQLPVCPEHFIAIGAAWECGAIHVGAHRDLTGAELADLVAHTQAAAVVFQPAPDVANSADPLAALRAVREANPATLAIVHGHAPEAGGLGLAELLAVPEAAPASAMSSHPDGTALLLLTSGTTGRPKAVMETLPALWGKVQFLADALSASEHDVHLMYLPVCHAFGLKLSLIALTSGGRLVLLDRFSPEAALRLVGKEHVTILSGTPTHLTLLLRVLDGRKHRVESLRWAVSAAAPLQPALVEEVYERLATEILHVYGCSEGFVTLTADQDEIRRGSVGRRVFCGPAGTPPDGSVAILDPEHDARVPDGAVGEIAFGAARPVGYWGGPDVAVGGWYRTGDLGRIDSEGRLFVCGRLKDQVNRGGLKVACGEVESALARHPAVADCAVIPTPDPVLGEAICACIVAAGRLVPDLREVRALLHGTLARHKLPDELCVLPSIPRSAAGKINRAALLAAVVGGDAPRERFRSDVATTAAALR